MGNIEGKVDKLMYIWVPSEKKANLFYHLVGTKFYATNTGTSFFDKIDVGHDAYVKADDVKFVNGVQLTPLNTAAEAQVAAQKKWILDKEINLEGNQI